MHRLYGRNRSDRDTVDASVVIQGGARARIGQDSQEDFYRVVQERVSMWYNDNKANGFCSANESRYTSSSWIYRSEHPLFYTSEYTNHIKVRDSAGQPGMINWNSLTFKGFRGPRIQNSRKTFPMPIFCRRPIRTSCVTIFDRQSTYYVLTLNDSSTFKLSLSLLEKGNLHLHYKKTRIRLRLYIACIIFPSHV